MSLPVSAAVGQSAALSQLAIVPGDETRDDAAFPKGLTDGNSDLNQQLDLRAKNSWMLKLEEVSTPEMAEVLAYLNKGQAPDEPFSFAEFSQAADFLSPVPDEETFE